MSSTRRRKPERDKPLLSLIPAIVIAAASGPVLDAAYPDKDIWPLAFVGIAMVLITLIGRRAGTGFLVGFIAGLSFYLTHIFWATLYLGPAPWAALSTLEALFFGLGGMLITLAYRWGPRVWTSAAGRYAAVPAVVAALWTAREVVAGTWPYGGFAWGRVALSQSQSPFADLVSWLGLSGVSFVIVFITAVIVQVLIAPGPLKLSAAVLPVGLIASVLIIPIWPTQQNGTTTIAAVQGNGKAGYFDEREPGDILVSQLKATQGVIGHSIDLLVWPENGSDLDPTRDSSAAVALNLLSQSLGGAPILTGTITKRDGLYYNSSLLLQEGRVADYYDKVRPVPFGEYVPDRSFWEPFAPDLIGLIQREYTPGTRDAVMNINGMIAGVSICFDIVDDGLVRDTVDRGAQIILAQTNNADFGQTDENQQQLAIARMRAIETGRALVNISTVGESQMIAPDGSTIQEIPAYQPGYLLQTLPLMRGETPAVKMGGQIELFIVLAGLSALVAAGTGARRPRQGR
ncbi:apolipoprotein N-acyltransferase [Microbacterium sp. MPKO10]|uniref:apolipoprotein N-acyltransferase n=1 Tax=Microbacterium sp. MPKO10 TaxID=2989818 RepID=UPI0022369B9D|nr:apolipoprotein N-acyltransferase [Microbacterium sp. MPKO10]MCW4459446.1 apolipoprotein N-acyltransferase [Microbacterium sp. MPKO10]